MQFSKLRWTQKGIVIQTTVCWLTKSENARNLNKNQEHHHQDVSACNEEKYEEFQEKFWKKYNKEQADTFSRIWTAFKEDCEDLQQKNFPNTRAR